MIALKQTIQVKSASTEANAYGYNTIVVEVTYDKGGADYFGDNTHTLRGFTLLVRPEKVEDGCRKFRAYDGNKKFMEEAKRYNAKRHAALFDELIEGKHKMGEASLVDYLVGTVMERNGLVKA